jgi:hypothetical protein
MIDRWRSAIHESAHAFALWRFGWPVELVSIRPGASHTGITMAATGTDRDLLDMIGQHHPLDGLDPEARRLADRMLVMVLIGDAAVEVLAPQTGRQPDPVGYLESAAYPRPAELTPEIRDRLAAAEADTADRPDDADKAFEQAFRLVGLAAHPYLAWLAFETRLLVREHAAAIYALADVLVARELIDGRTAVAIFRAHERS